MKNHFALSAVALVASAIAAPAMAATIVPVAVTASSSYPSYGANFAIDQGPGSASTDWASFSQGNASFLGLDLGAAYFLTSVSGSDRVTSGGANGAFVGGTTDFTTQYSISYYADNTYTNPFAVFNFSKATPGSPTTATSFAFSDVLTGGKVRYVGYQVLTTNGPNPGLADISFTGSVPEPTTWAMMLAGFGMVGFGMRRRSSVSTTVRFA